jgi:hypothetical protein
VDNINATIPGEWHDYVTQKDLGLEVVPSVLYSTKDYVSTVTTLLPFFDFVNAARLDLTNMVQPSMLPQPESMLIQGIRVFFKTGFQSDIIGAAGAIPLVSGYNDVVQLSKDGILKLTIGNKKYGPWPLWTLPAATYVQGDVATGSPTSSMDYGQIGGMIYSLFPNLMISPLQQFSVTLEWPAGAKTLSATPLPIQVLFDGQLARSVQ